MFAHRKNWMRHNAMVPKGFIRLHVLEALEESPKSGSEIMEQIEKRTNGFWKPSPGSIYPLLAWLQEKGYVNELPMENGLKRYQLTESGKQLLEEQKTIRKKVREQVGFLPAPFFEGLLFKIPNEKASEIRDSVRQLAITFFKMSNSLQKNFSEKSLDEAIEIIKETTRKLEDLDMKLKRNNHE